MESWEVARFRKAAQRLFRANLRSVAAAAISSPLMDVFGAVAIALLLLLGRAQIAHNELTLGAFIAFVAAVLSMYNPVRKFAVFNNSFQQALGASSQLFTFMDAEDVVIEKPRAKALPPFSQSVRFEGVCFSYQSDGEDSREILSGIDLEVKRGEILAVVGSSGAGKSTLVHLLPRFFDVTAGRILVDGHDVRDVTLASLRSQIGMVAQNTVLFNDTVRKKTNIAYGQPHVPLKDVEAAARAALAHDFILALPSGYDTVIGERGVRASRRRTPALGHCSCAAEECPDSDSRRSHLCTRQRVGGAGTVRLAQSHERTNGLRDCPSSFNGAPGEPDRRNREWNDRRNWSARGIDAARRHIPAAL